MRAARLFGLALLLVLVAPLFASAASFPDVPANYPHRIAIEALVDRGVITGNPDGTFKPYNPVDRASMLKMLYKAGGLTVNSTSKKCFPDVLEGSWYEGFVCDAVSRGYVQGYDNGQSFKPGKAVTRSEALKMAIAVLGVAEADAGVSVTMYVDVKTTDWFSPYVRTALARKMLPIAGQDGASFLPNNLLERGEAAAYIWNALAAKLSTQEQAGSAVDGSSHTSSATGQKSSADAMQEKREQQQKSEEAALQEDLKNSKQVNFPFTETATFSGKHSLSFRFKIGTLLTSEIVAMLTSGDAKAKVSCRLYRIEKDGFSNEYYLGLEDGKGCYLRSTLAVGEYQLELFPSAADVSVSVTGKTTTGDGNDGFADAKPLVIGKARIEVLEANDLEDWYSFKVTHSTAAGIEQGQKHTVKLISGSSIGCLIYPMADVDLFSFSGPVCNEEYIFPVGTYMVNVRHSLPRAARLTYTLEVK